MNHANYGGFNGTAYNSVTTTAITPLATPMQMTAVTNFGTPSNDSEQLDGTSARELQTTRFWAGLSEE